MEFESSKYKKSIIGNLSLGLSIMLFLFSTNVMSELVFDDLIVTANKREQKLEDVGSSVIVIDKAEFSDLHINSVRDIAEQVAGVQVFDSSSNTPYFVIRGIGPQDFLGNTAPSAAVHVDGVYKSSNVNSGTSLFDIERVEIVKGPQGTLYGRNNTAGSVNVITNQPTFKSESNIAATFAEFENYLFEGVQGGAINESIAYRLSGRYEVSGGFVDNVEPSTAPTAAAGFAGVGNQPLPNGIDNELGDLDRWALRGQLLFEPEDNLSLLLKGEFAQDNSEVWPYTMVGTGLPITTLGSAADGLLSPSQCPAFSFDPATGNVTGGTPNPNQCVNAAGAVDSDPRDFNVSSDFIGEFDNDYYNLSINIDVSTRYGDITSITAYEGFNWQQTADYDGTTAAVRTLEGKGLTSKSSQWSQEIRLNNSNNPDWDWLTGLYFSYDIFEFEGNARLDFDGNPANGSGLCNVIQDFLLPLPAGPAIGSCIPGFTAFNDGFIISDHKQTTLTSAVFTDHNWQLTEEVKLKAGLRFTWEQRDFESISIIRFEDGSEFLSDFFGPANDGIPATTAGPRIRDEIDTKKFSGHIGLDYRINDELLFYSNIARGFKSGGWDGNFVVDGSLLQPYKEEIVTNYEIGFKSKWFDKTLSLNATAFYTYYKNPQLRKNILIGGSIPNSRLDNIDAAEIFGLELDSKWSPTSELTFSSTLSLMQSNTEDFNEELAPLSNSSALFFDNKALPFTAEVAVTFDTLYRKPLTETFTAFIRGNVNYTGAHFLDTANLNFEEQSYALFNASTGIVSKDEKWRVSLWAKNITNEFYYTSVLAGFSARIYNFNRPRQVGITAALQF